MEDKDKFILTDSCSGVESITVTDTITLDLDYGAAQASISNLNLDTITLGDMSSSSTITLPHTNYVSSYGGSGGIYTTGTSYNWTTSTPTVNIDNDGVNIRDGGDLKIGGHSLKEFMTKMEQRLAILVPDPAKLEKFEALKKAYEHYKTMERLCQIEEDNDNK